MDEKEILDLAEAVGLVFWEPAAAEPINRLIKVTADHWKTLSDRTEVIRYRFVSKLLSRCPILYARPPGFTWITDYLVEVERARKISPTLDRDLWETTKIIWAEDHKGPSWDMARDLLWSEWAQNVKEVRKIKGRNDILEFRKMKKSEAIGCLLAANKNERSIWRSVKRVNDYYKNLINTLGHAGFTMPSNADHHDLKKKTK